MSVLLKAILNAHALEHDRIRNAAAQIATNGPLINRGLITVPSPSEACVIDAINLVADPQGLGGLNWTSVPAGAIRTLTGGPGQWAVFMRATATAAQLSVTKTPTAVIAAGHPFYAYLLIRAVHAPVTITAKGVTSAVTYATLTLTTLAGGWQLVSLTGVIGAASEQVGLTVSAASVVAGDTLDVTGVTVCQDTDPGAPFSGDLDDEFNYAYRWASGRNNSLSRRHTTSYDVLAVAEGEAGIDIDAMGLSTGQRQGYLTQRFQARYQPELGDPEHDILSGAPSAAQVAADNATGWLTGFKQQIGDVIRADGGHYDDNRTTVFVNAPGRSFTVQIAYSASGPLIDRINRLIMDIKPGHLAFDPASGLTAGGFLADVGQTDSTLL